jgi:hypothetical protein
VERVCAEAARVDAEEDARLGAARGDELPARLAGRDGRVARLRRALEQLDGQAAERLAESGAERRVARAKQRLERARARQQGRVDAYAQAVAVGKRPTGSAPVPPERHGSVRRAEQQVAAAEAAYARAAERAGRTARGHERKANVTDPDSRLMRAKGAWIQGYNAQAGVAEDGLAVAAAVTNDVNDAPMLHPLIDQAQRLVTAAGGQPAETVVADAGYWNPDNVEHGDVESPPAPLLLLPPRDFNTADDDRDPAPAVPDDASPAEHMRHRLRTPEGKARYAKRAPQAEGPFGHLKTAFGFTKFSRRGANAVESEWHLILAVRNLTLLHRRRAAARPAVA